MSSGSSVSSPTCPTTRRPRRSLGLRRDSTRSGLLQRGHSTEQIAAELNISRDTVRNHVADLLRALGAKSRLEAVALSFGR